MYREFQTDHRERLSIKAELKDATGRALKVGDKVAFLTAQIENNHKRIGATGTFIGITKTHYCIFPDDLDKFALSKGNKPCITRSPSQVILIS